MTPLPPSSRLPPLPMSVRMQADPSGLSSPALPSLPLRIANRMRQPCVTRHARPSNVILRRKPLPSDVLKLLFTPPSAARCPFSRLPFVKVSPCNLPRCTPVRSSLVAAAYIFVSGTSFSVIWHPHFRGRCVKVLGCRYPRETGGGKPDSIALSVA